MKKLNLVFIGLLLSLSSFGQQPFEVDKILEIENGDTVLIDNKLTDVGVKLKTHKGTSYIKLFFEANSENPEYSIKFRSKRLEIVEAIYEGDFTTFICQNDEMGTLEIIRDCCSGRINYDADQDGVIEKIIIFKEYE